VLLAGLAGCGLGPGATPHGVQLDITDDFGTRPVLSTSAPQISGSDTVMRLLERNAKITTRYGGGFVQSVNGLAGGTHSDWFYYVNGNEAPKGAAATTLNGGDHVWWDRHDWSATETIPAVVGSYPEPFLNGYGGQRLPTRVECVQPGGSACTTVANDLAALGIPAAQGGFELSEQNQSLRILVGPWSKLRSDAAAALLGQGPAASGVYAQFGDGGASLALLNPQGRTAGTLGAGSGLVAATRASQTVPPVWLITGTDDAGVSAAVQALDAGTLHDRFAVAVAQGVGVPVPITQGG
jgi:hypothetical protein